MSKKRKRSITAPKIILIILLSIFAELIISNNCLSVTKITVKNDKIPSSFQGYRIVQLSDLHDKSFGEDNTRLISAVKSADPDIIALAGDMVNSSDANFNTFYSLAQQLVKVCPVYFAVGNHEQMLDAGLREELIKTLKSIGVIVLDNENTTLEKDGEKIRLYGLWFNLRYYRNLTNAGEAYYFTQDNTRQLLGEKSDEYTILLTHNPVYFNSYSAWGADLTLSGHLHGGMIRIPFIGGLFSPEKKFFPQYDAGVFKTESSVLFVSRGLGNGKFGIRFLNRPEIVIITLENK
jgi:predicted MPP superfamily phosphohydrolase